MHNLRVGVFHRANDPRRKASADGPTDLSLRGIRLPPYLHDGRLHAEDTVEFFNLVLVTKLTELKKRVSLAFLRAL
jgi:cytochrome c peroxidase